MYNYKAKQRDTYQVIIKNFPTYEEAEAYLKNNSGNHTNAKIESLFANIDGIIIEEDIKPSEDETEEE